MRLVTAIVARNEVSRYLAEVLEQCVLFSHVVLLDDASTDDTAALAASLGAEVHSIAEPLWETHEGRARERLYALAMRHEPEWLYVPDADELLEDIRAFNALLDGDGPYTFEMLHAWGSRDAFRVDGYWGGQQALRLFRPPRGEGWRNMPIHCGSAPESVQRGPKVASGLRVFHLGYADPQDAVTKYGRYSMLDPGGRHSPQSHYDSMLLPPTLVDVRGCYVLGDVQPSPRPGFGVTVVGR